MINYRDEPRVRVFVKGYRFSSLLKISANMLVTNW